MKYLLFCTVVAFLVCIVLPSQAQYYITTIAGKVDSPAGGFGGDGGPALQARLAYPNNITVDSTGNVYIADVNNKRIRKVDIDGIINTIAGNGSTGYFGDGGPASNASFAYPTGIATDDSGNIFIADAGNFCIRKMSRTGILSTIAGTGISGYTGDGGPATLAQLNGPNEVAIDVVGNLYIADYGNNCVRKVDTAGIITTMAGTGTRAVTGGIGDGGPATAAEFDEPTFVSTDHSGNVFIIDGSFRVRKVDITGFISTVAGGGTHFKTDTPATYVYLWQPASVVNDNSGNMYISILDRPPTGHANPQILKVNTLGILDSFAGTTVTDSFGGDGDGGPATTALFNYPCGLALDRFGNIFVADARLARIRIIYKRPSLFFTGGRNQTLSICENNSNIAINSLLAIQDSGVHKTDSWSILSPPRHGTANATFSASSIWWYSYISTPTGLSYTPFYGYSGNDTFSVVVKNGPTYSLNGTIASDTTQIIVSVAPLPALGSISGTPSICVGATTSLSDLYYSSGIWLSLNSAANMYANMAIGISPGIDTILYIGSNTCGSDTISHILTILALPNAGAITGSASACIDATVTLNDSITGGIWSTSVALGVASISLAGVVSCFTASAVSIFYTVSTDCGIATTSFIMNIYDSVTPYIRIHSLSDSICPGASINFSSLVLNGGTYPAYKWLKNGMFVAPYATYTGTGLNDGDTIQSIVTSNAYCTIIDTAISNALRITILPIVIPSVSIAASNNSPCAGEPVSFTPSPHNGGTMPLYYWYVFSRLVIITDSIFTYSPSFGDVVTCEMISNAQCAVPDTVTSNDITIFTSPIAHPTITITSDLTPADTVSYPGQLITFFSGTTYGGLHPHYQWFINGLSSPGDTTNTLSINIYNIDTVFCTMQSNEPCAPSIQDTSNSMIIFPALSTEIPNITNNFEETYILPTPNPATSTIDFQLSMHQSVRIKIIDLSGKLIASQEYDANTTIYALKPVHISFDVHNYQRGIYIYQIISKANVFTGIVLIE